MGKIHGRPLRHVLATTTTFIVGIFFTGLAVASLAGAAANAAPTFVQVREVAGPDVVRPRQSAQPAGCTGAWNVVASPNASFGDYLLDVKALAADDMWAVGFYRQEQGIPHTLAEHWDGTAWSVIPTPDSPRGDDSLIDDAFFNTVEIVSHNDVWAVGYWGVGPNYITLIEHWNGTAWSRVSSPSPSISGNFLTGIEAVSANNVWAVGDAGRSGGSGNDALVEHWNGTAWSLVSTPGVAGSTSEGLSDLAVLSANDIWAVGSYQISGTARTLTEHWNGTAWSVVFSPNSGTDNNYVVDISALSATDIWAIGGIGFGFPYPAARTLALHWDGTQWSLVPTANPPSAGRLEAVAAISPTDVWAVGSSWANNIQTSMIEHWNGSIWSITPNPDPIDTVQSQLAGVVGLSANNVWAVGSYTTTGDPANQTLVKHYTNGGCPTNTPTTVASNTPSPTRTPTRTATATAVAQTNTPTNTAVVGSTSTSTPTSEPGTTNTPTATSEPQLTNTPTAVSTAASTATPTATATLCAMSFTDVHPTDYFYTAVHNLYCAGVISGYADGTFRPFSQTTRGQLSKIVVLAETFPIDTTGGPHFTDVPTTNPFYVFIETAYNRGLISGYGDGTFRWGSNVTRGQLSKIVVIAEGWSINTQGGPHFIDVPTTQPFYAFIETAYNRGIVSGYSDGTFRPGNDATRGQISKIVYSAITQP